MKDFWAIKYSNCINCGRNDIPHVSRGLCRTCYQYQRNMIVKPKKRNMPTGNIKKIATQEYLHQRYIINGDSLQDIASDLKCTRAYIYKLMEEYGFERRTRKQARVIATHKGKIKFEYEDYTGNIKTVKHTPLEIDRSFFYKWSDGFAYFLGFVFTDGNLLKIYYNRRFKKHVESYQVSISQKDSYILEKLRDLISLNKPILRVKNNKDSYIHYLTFRDKEIFERLESLGLTPNKSLTIKFPEIPLQYLGGFVRGLFDGDGSYTVGQAKLTTGSEMFANGLKSTLESVGIHCIIYTVPKSEKRKNQHFTVNIRTSNSGLSHFYTFLYENATIFIPKKRERLEELIKYGPNMGNYFKAYHKAGHAVACVRLGLELRHPSGLPINIYPGFFLDMDDWWNPTEAQNYLIALYSGYAAQVKSSLYRPKLAREETQGDFDKAIKIITAIGESNEDTLISKAMEFVSSPENWKAIEELAKELLTNKTLNESDVRNIILNADGYPPLF